MSGWIGARVAQREDRRLVRGRGVYVDDLHLPGMLHLAVLRSPHAHALLGAVDLRPALASEGVVAGFTAAELRGDTEPFTLRHAGHEARPLSYYALAFDRVRYAGEPVAAIVATDRYRAEAALDRIEAAYEPLPPLPGAHAALAPGAPRLYDEWPDNCLIHHRVCWGDVERALAEADVVVDEQISSHRHTASPLEPRGLVADYDGNRLTVWASHQMPHMLRTLLAELLRFPEAQIRVVAPQVGGGFGVKYNFYPEDVLVAYAALRLGSPVKWIEDRREHFLATAHAREQEHRVTLGFRSDGTLLAVRTQAVVDLGAGNILLPGVGPMFAGAASMPMGYRFEHYEYDGRGVVTNKTPSGAYRGFGVTEVCLALEQAMDAAARRLGMDAAELRRRNLLRPKDLPYRGPTGSYLTGGSFRASLEAALDAIDYAGFRRRQAEARREGRLLGVGVATFVEGNGASQFALSGFWGNYEYCRIQPSPDGRVVVHSGLASQGQSHETTLAQIVADELGLDLDDVAVVLGDTDQTPYGMGAFASRGALLGGAAAVLACRDLKEKLRRFVADVAEASLADVEYDRGVVRVRGAPRHAWTFRELARLSYLESRRLPPGHRPVSLQGEAVFDMTAVQRPADPEGRQPRYAAWTDGACAATCEVDVETGMVRLLNVALAHDCGRVINPVAVDGQMIGGLAQAIGGTFLEHLVYSEDGQPLTTTFMDYLLPTAADMPPIRLAHFETPAAEIPGGFKGVGESANIVGPAALANAVADALAPLGVQVRQTPLSPARIWELVQAARAGAEWR